MSTVIEWLDETSYRRGERAEGAEPRVWTCRTVPGFSRICVHRVVGEESWHLTTGGGDLFSDYPLASVAADSAKIEALRLIATRLRESLEVLDPPPLVTVAWDAAQQKFVVSMADEPYRAREESAIEAFGTFLAQTDVQEALGLRVRFL